jgi:hypothetical protein
MSETKHSMPTNALEHQPRPGDRESPFLSPKGESQRNRGEAK